MVNSPEFDLQGAKWNLETSVGQCAWSASIVPGSLEMLFECLVLTSLFLIMAIHFCNFVDIWFPRTNHQDILRVPLE